jgi:hypothetical protein
MLLLCFESYANSLSHLHTSVLHGAQHHISVLVGNTTLSPDLKLYLFTLCFCDALKLMPTVCPTCIHLFFMEHSITSFQFPVLVGNATLSPDLELYLFTLHFCDALKLTVIYRSFGRENLILTSHVSYSLSPILRVSKFLEIYC